MPEQKKRVEEILARVAKADAEPTYASFGHHYDGFLRAEGEFLLALVEEQDAVIAAAHRETDERCKSWRETAEALNAERKIAEAEVARLTALVEAQSEIVEAATVFVEDAIGGYGGNVWRFTEDGRRLIASVERAAAKKEAAGG